MSDDNKNGLLDPEEAEETVEEEETVADAFQGDKITKEEVAQIDSLDDLGNEAEKIKLAEEMGSAGEVATINDGEDKAEDLDIAIPAKEDKKEDTVGLNTPAEAVQESVSEKSSEPSSEASIESKEVIQETRKPLI